jgi:hypothetical protein
MQARSGAYLVSIFLLSGLAGCEDQCSSFSPNKFNCQQIADASYNVHFNLPDDTEICSDRQPASAIARQEPPATQSSTPFPSNITVA